LNNSPHSLNNPRSADLTTTAAGNLPFPTASRSNAGSPTSSLTAAFPRHNNAHSIRIPPKPLWIMLPISLSGRLLAALNHLQTWREVTKQGVALGLQVFKGRTEQACLPRVKPHSRFV
jgi:hypothetical protein